MRDNLLRGGKRRQQFFERSAGFAAGAENAINEAEDNGGLLWVSHYGSIIAQTPENTNSASSPTPPALF